MKNNLKNYKFGDVKITLLKISQQLLDPLMKNFKNKSYQIGG